MNMIFSKSAPKILAAASLLVIMFGGYLVLRKKNQIAEASKLPFTQVELSDIDDGVYSGKTYTSFLHLELEVEVKEHRLTDIKVLKNDGIDGETAKPIINEMIKQNSIVVPAIKGAELGSIVYISCVNQALVGHDDMMIRDAGTDKQSVVVGE